MKIQKNTYRIKSFANELGFSYCGISKSGFLNEEAVHLEHWLSKKYNGKMHYMENHFDKRVDTTKLVEGSKSVISLLYNYYTPKKQFDKDAPIISKYAYGKDYHIVIKEKLSAMVQKMRVEFGDFNARIFTDSAPVLDKAWAKKSGLGWIGKNSNLITKKNGSFFFIAEIICDLEFEYDHPMRDYCGTCTACIDACPTEAIVHPQVVDGSKCISYFTIELKDALLPEEMKGKFANRVFGCDICQDVCPWNRFSSPHSETLFEPMSELLDRKKEEWNELTEEIFTTLFKDSPIQRTGYKGLMRNIKFLEETSRKRIN